MSSRITHNPEQCGGRPCIRGMRIRVQDILELFAAGQSSEQILADFPDLEAEDLKAALAYAAREIDHPVLVGLGSGSMRSCRHSWRPGSTRKAGASKSTTLSRAIEHLREGEPWVEIRQASTGDAPSG
jgi:uncharacterized protein (DUF433 family)